MEVVAVIDFETTGLSPLQGDRATEVAAVIVDNGRVVDRYQSLMNAGVRIPAYIEALTGISNAMVRSAPSAEAVMREVSDFVGGIPIVAHNASFDARFWDAELARIQRFSEADLPHALANESGIEREKLRMPDEQPPEGYEGEDFQLERAIQLLGEGRASASQLAMQADKAG